MSARITWRSDALGEFMADGFEHGGWRFSATLMPTCGVNVVCAGGRPVPRGGAEYIAAQIAATQAFLALVGEQLSMESAA